MSILIKGMEMPDSCFHCKLADVCQHYKAEHYANKRHEDCPLEEVPETHDKRTETHACDLISRQALCEYALNQKDKSVTPNDIMRFPSADLQLTCNQLATDCISRQAAIDAIHEEWDECLNVDESGKTIAYETEDVICRLPSAQPERLADDDFETIRIHLNAYKEKLCNQQRWEEADEYQRIIDRFMAFASAQPEPYKGEA